MAQSTNRIYILCSLSKSAEIINIKLFFYCNVLFRVSQINIIGGTGVVIKFRKLGHVWPPVPPFRCTSGKNADSLDVFNFKLEIRISELPDKILKRNTPSSQNYNLNQQHHPRWWWYKKLSKNLKKRTKCSDFVCRLHFLRE